MRKPSFAICVLAIPVSLLIISLAFAKMPGPDSAALWNYITKESPYQKWSFWPDHQGMQFM